MKTISDIMTKEPIIHDCEISVSKAVSIMREKKIGALLFKENDTVDGIFTERDLLTKIDFKQPGGLDATLIKSVMTRNLLTVNASDSFIDVIQLMQEKNIRHTPVTISKEEKEIIGMVSLRDLLNHYQEHLREQLMIRQAVVLFQVKDIKETEEKFHIIFDRSPIGIMLTDKNERIISWNSFSKKMLGMNDEDLLNKPVKDLYPREEWENIRSQNIRHLGKKEHLESKIINKSGGLIDVELSISILKDADGNIEGSIGIMQNISERKRIEKKMTERTRKGNILFQLIQNLTPDMSSKGMLGLIVTAAKSLVNADTASIILLDNQNKESPTILDSESSGLGIDDSLITPDLNQNTNLTGWIVANKEPLLLYGKAEADKRFKDIEWKDGIKCSINVPIISKGSVKGTFNLNITDSDHIFTHDDLEAIVSLASHSVVALENSGLFQDMKVKYLDDMRESTESLDKLNTELVQSQDKLIQADKMASVGQLASGVAHEINNPLTGILGNIQLINMDLKEGNEVKDLGELVGIIEHSCKRAKGLAQSLLDFSRLKKPVLEPFDVHNSLESVIKLCSYNLKNAKVEIVRKFNADIPKAIGISNEIEQIFLNMLSNGQWAVEKTEKPGTITIDTHKLNDNFIEINFTDSGVGMSQETIDKIFEPFFTTKEVGKGTGLGLPVCVEIIRKHKGEMKLDSEVGVGTTFHIIIPIAK